MAMVYESSAMFVKHEQAKATAAEQAAKKIEEAEKRQEEAIKSLAEFDEKMKFAKLTEEQQKQKLLEENYEKQKAEIEALHEIQLINAEDELKIKEEQQMRLKKMEDDYNKEKEAIKEDAHNKELLRMAEISRITGEGMEFAKDMLKSLKDESATYRLAYKTAAIGEAIINATQSVLKTMAGIPFPYNIPLASAQAAAAAVQVKKIATTKMYRGGMIPGANTLIMANEQGREAILNTRAVRAVGGEAGVNALNRGNTYDHSRSSTININMSTSIMTQKAFRDEVEPILKRAERRR